MKKTTKSLLAVTVAGVLALSGCAGSGGASPSGDASGGLTIGVVLSDASNPFFQTMADAIKEAGAAAGVEIIERSAPVGTDNETFNNNVDSLITLGVDGLITAPISASNQQALQRAVDKGIPVVELDSAIADWGGSIAEIQTDNVQAGSDAIDLLVEGLDGKDVNAIIINNTLGYKSVDDRTEGAKAAIEAAGATLVQVVDGGVSQAEAQSNVETVLRAHPEINAIMGTVSVYALGGMQALRTAGVDDGSVLVTGVDGSDAEFEAIEAGTYYGTAAQQPAEMGRMGLQAILDSLDGKDVEASILVPPVKVTAANVAEFLK